MAYHDLTGRWILPPQNYEVNIVMTAGGEFNIKAVGADLQVHWKGGEGQVFESGKIYAVVRDPSPDVRIEGYVTSDSRTINWNNGFQWHKR